MIIKKYGIELQLLTKKDIELVRQERNKDFIRSKMINQSIINSKQQQKWFKTINNSNNFYFIIVHENKKIGLIHGKNIDWKKKEDEGGIFIWDENYVGTGIAAKASILLMQLNFSLAGLDRTYIRVHEDNKFAKEYNLMLGYRPTIHKGVYVLTKEVYNKRILKLRHIASLGKDLSPLSLDNIIINDFEKNHHIYKSLPKNLYLMAKKIIEKQN